MDTQFVIREYNSHGGHFDRGADMDEARALLGIPAPLRVAAGQSVPYCCPVCNGQRSVSPGFYTLGVYNGTTSNETCLTCAGEGILWSKPEVITHD